MQITVKFFASLRERVGRSETKLEVAAPITAAEVWKRAAGAEPMPTNTLVAVNMEYADVNRRVAPGDEVAFFPPVTGGCGRRLFAPGTGPQPYPILRCFPSIIGRHCSATRYRRFPRQPIS